jgi:hypothetical protein
MPSGGSNSTGLRQKDAKPSSPVTLPNAWSVALLTSADHGHAEQEHEADDPSDTGSGRDLLGAGSTHLEGRFEDGRRRRVHGPGGTATTTVSPGGTRCRPAWRAVLPSTLAEVHGSDEPSDRRSTTCVMSAAR